MTRLPSAVAYAFLAIMIGSAAIFSVHDVYHNLLNMALAAVMFCWGMWKKEVRVVQASAGVFFFFLFWCFVT